MVVGYDPCDKRQLTTYGFAASGAISGVFTRALVQPLDVLKIRFQLQVEPITRNSKSSKYQGMLQACSTIYKEEGLKAFWKGHAPAQILSVVYGIVQFASFELLTKRIAHTLPSKFTTEWRPITHFVVGGTAGCIATLAAQPFDVIRTRFIAQGEAKVYLSVLHATKCMISQEGWRSLFKGLTPTLCQIAPQSGLQFSFYALFTQIWKFMLKEESTECHTGHLESFLCGATAGISAKVVIYPLDLMKKRLQIQGFEHGRATFGRTSRYIGLLSCFHTITVEEGIKGLYKGLAPSSLKAMVSVGCSFYFYEQCCEALLSVTSS